MNTKKRLAAAVGLLFVSSGVWAQSAPVRPTYQFPGGERSGGVELGDSGFFAKPYAAVSLGHDSNIFSSDLNKVSSSTETYIAGSKFDARRESSVIQVDLQAKYGRYSDSTADNYSDPYFRGTYDVAFDARNFLRVGYNYLRLHDPRGSTDRPPTNSEPDRYYDNAPSVIYAYGAKDAKGRIEVYVTNTIRRYLNNKEVTVAYDRDMTDYGGIFYWRVMPKTNLLFEARGTDIKYKLSTSILNSDEYRYLVGVSWEATAATTGVAKIGRQQKKFDSSTLQDYSGTNWELDLTWKPLSYSTVSLNSARLPVESTGLGSFTLSDRTGGNWAHNWNDRFSTDVYANFTKDRYQGATRTDKTTTLGLRGSYQMRKWLTLGAEYTNTERDSDVDVNDYSRDIWFVFARMTM